MDLAAAQRPSLSIQESQGESTPLDIVALSFFSPRLQAAHAAGEATTAEPHLSANPVEQTAKASHSPQIPHPRSGLGEPKKLRRLSCGEVFKVP